MWWWWKRCIRMRLLIDVFRPAGLGVYRSSRPVCTSLVSLSPHVPASPAASPKFASPLTTPHQTRFPTPHTAPPEARAHRPRDMYNTATRTPRRRVFAYRVFPRIERRRGVRRGGRRRSRRGFGRRLRARPRGGRAGRWCVLAWCVV